MLRSPLLLSPSHDESWRKRELRLREQWELEG